MTGKCGSGGPGALEWNTRARDHTVGYLKDLEDTSKADEEKAAYDLHVLLRLQIGCTGK